MAFRQQEPVVPSMFHQPPARLDEALLQTRERPGVDSRRQHQPPPEIPEVVREDAQLQPDLVGPECSVEVSAALRSHRFGDPIKRNVGSVERRAASLRSS